VSAHVSNLMGKPGVTNRAEAAQIDDRLRRTGSPQQA
jgi:DNA-binding CsgD family transcriptional regulator